MTAHHMKELSTWPGISFDIERKEAKAILGTPNGKGVAWLLAQHRAQLGEKTVKKVTLVYVPGPEPKRRNPSLVFWLEDLVEEDGKKEEGVEDG